MVNDKNSVAQEILRSLRKFRFLDYEVLRKAVGTLANDLVREMIAYNYIEIDFDENGVVILKEPSNRFEHGHIHKDSNAILLSSTNEYMEAHFQFRDGVISFMEGMLFFYGRYEEIVFRTSLLKSYKIEEERVIFETLNSTYAFKLLKKIEIEGNLAKKEIIEQVLQNDEYFVFL